MVNEEPNALSRINSSTFLASIPILFLRLMFTTSLYFLNDRNVSKLGRDRWMVKRRFPSVCGNLSGTGSSKDRHLKKEKKVHVEALSHHQRSF